MSRIKEKKDIAQSVLPRKLTPFMSIGTRLEDNLKETVIELLYLIREHGINQIKPDVDKPDEILKFAELVHVGWKKAHLIIAEELKKRLSIRNEILKVRKKRYEDQAQKADIENAYSTNSIEIIVLRRMLDSIAWTMLKAEHSTVRRLQVRDSESNLSIKNIEDALPTANIWNKDPQTVAICSDMTTFVHIGDLLVYKYDQGKVFFAELKDGEKNTFFADAAQFSIQSECEVFDEVFTENLEKTDLKHYNRIKRQLKRGNEATETINNEGGYDSSLNRNINIHQVDIPVERYSGIIVECCNEITDKKTWSIATIDECLHIGVYSDWEQGFVGFNVWMDLIKCKSRIYNLTDSFPYSTALPFASLDLPTIILEKVLKGKLIIVMCLDIRSFLKVANDKFPDFLKLRNTKQDRKASQLIDLLEHEGQFIGSDSGGLLGSGFLDRILFDLQCPVNALTMIYQMAQSKEK